MQIRKTLPDFYYGMNKEEEKFKKFKIVEKDTVILEDGSKYQGQWNQETGKRHGYGIHIATDGSIHEGYFKDDLANGRGRLIDLLGGVYLGNWKNGQKHNFGKQTNGRQKVIYEGYWANNLHHGYGKQVTEDNTKFEGNF